MTNTSNVGNAEQNGSLRLNPRQIAVKLITVAGGSPVSVLDATDEQFEAFIKQIGIPVKAGDEGQRWSFDNRCRAINYALKYRLHLPFVDTNNSEPNKNNSDSELLPRPEPAPQAMIDIPGAPIISGWANILKATLQNDEHPLPPIAPTGGRDYPDLEEGERDEA